MALRLTMRPKSYPTDGDYLEVTPNAPGDLAAPMFLRGRTERVGRMALAWFFGRLADRLRESANKGGPLPLDVATVLERCDVQVEIEERL